MRDAHEDIRQLVKSALVRASDDDQDTFVNEVARHMTIDERTVSYIEAALEYLRRRRAAAVSSDALTVQDFALNGALYMQMRSRMGRQLTSVGRAADVAVIDRLIGELEAAVSRRV